MLWAVLLIVTVAGVALPALLWWLTRRMASARPPYAPPYGVLLIGLGLMRPRLPRRRLERSLRLNT